MSEKPIGQDYWNKLYQNNETGWDIGYPSPPIIEYVHQLKDKNLNILIPGCGNCYEAEYLLHEGFTNITLIDIAPTLTLALEEKFKGSGYDRVKILTGDFFEHEGKYDLIIEQTFLSALPPYLRGKYADKMVNLLKPGGSLIGVLFNKMFDESPPFGGNEEEYRTLFEPLFDIKVLTTCYNSIDRRAGSEVFINMRPKALL